MLGDRAEYVPHGSQLELMLPKRCVRCLRHQPRRREMIPVFAVLAPGSSSLLQQSLRVVRTTQKGTFCWPPTALRVSGVRGRRPLGE